jgi:Viral BACON domain/Carboxypeptidase regulatory-like domain
MSRCERCSKPCSATAVFCDECRALLQNQYQTAKMVEVGEVRASAGMSPLVASSLQENGEGGSIFERITSPLPVVQVRDVQTPLPPAQEQVQETYNLVEQALSRLNEAAHRIAKAEGGLRRHPHASRLTPLRDISAEIQRESTPLPNVSATKGSDQGTDLARRMPDLWPWLQDGDAEESENDIWANRTDPLLARRFPNSTESARIEEEDMRRAIADGWITRPLPIGRKSRFNRMHTVFIILATLAVLALLMDGVLAGLAFLHTNHPANVHNGPPALILASSEASIGQTVVMHIRYFTPSTRVYLTHDIQQPVEIDNPDGSSSDGLLKVNTRGDADVSVLIDSSWGPGFHTVYAEDVTTRYTASSTLQIVGSGPTHPSQLVIGSSLLDFGPDYQGANTIQPLTLHNSGNGPISWAASSDQPWLLLSPAQGTFSSSQTIDVAVERSGLKPGDYKGKITFTANVGAPVPAIEVQMSVRALPANVGPVLVVTPAVLSFTALDGEASPNGQELVINNPGSQPLSWSLTSNSTTPLTFAGQQLLLHLFGDKNWLMTDPTSGVVQPGQTAIVHVYVDSQILLPGVYTSNLVFTASGGAVDSPQEVGVSLTVQPRCGLILSSGSISFTSVMGQSNPSNQALSLSATSSCTGSLNWQAQSSASWLTMTPTKGQLKAATSMVTSVAVNTVGLPAGRYEGTISFLTGANTQTVAVFLQVQSPPPTSAPIMGATPLNLNFSTTHGMPNPPGQVVTITNNGYSTLYWNTSVLQLASGWLGASPTGGSIAPGQTGQVTVNVATSSLMPGTYVGQITLNGADANGKPAGGSGQTIAVNLLVLPPCALAQPSLSTLTFNGVAGGANPAAQPVTITATGSCGWPLNWKASLTSSASWLTLTPTAGLITASGQSTSMSASVDMTGLAPGKYTTKISIVATDSASAAAQGSPEVIPVTLNVQSPCSLQVSKANLSFLVQQGQTALTSQNLMVSGVGGCTYPVTWTAAGDSGSSSWLSLSSTSGSDNGTGGTIGVNINPANLTVGSYSGTITISAKNGGNSIQGSPQMVTVNLTVTGSISGSVMACVGGVCTNAVPLPGATVNLLNSSGTQVASVTADASGNYSFSNVPSGTYTLSVSGTLSNITYTGTQGLTVSGNQSSVVIDAMPG